MAFRSELCYGPPNFQPTFGSLPMKSWLLSLPILPLLTLPALAEAQPVRDSMEGDAVVIFVMALLVAYICYIFPSLMAAKEDHHGGGHH